MDTCSLNRQAAKFMTYPTQKILRDKSKEEEQSESCWRKSVGSRFELATFFLLLLRLSFFDTYSRSGEIVSVSGSPRRYDTRSI